MRRKSKLEEKFASQLVEIGVKEKYIRDYVFLPHRKLELDFAFIKKKVAVEIQGGIYTGGAHARGPRMERDYEKLFLATVAGWKLIYVGSVLVKSGKAALWTKSYLWEMGVIHIVYDIETACPIYDGKLYKGVDEVKYANSWIDYKGMGISVIGVAVIDNKTCNLTRSFVYEVKEDRDSLTELIEREDAMMVGYNNHKFDDNVMRAHGFPIKRERSIDLLSVIRIASNAENDKYRGYKLDKIAALHLKKNMKKTEKAHMAPIYWQRGERQRVIDYCMSDVMITAELFIDILKEKRVINPKTKESVSVLL